jgi:hypothetical protein
MVCTLAISNLIRDAKTFQIASAMQTLDDKIQDLLTKKWISPENAYEKTNKNTIHQTRHNPQWRHGTRHSPNLLAKIIQAGQLIYADIAQWVGPLRTRVTANSNGNAQGVSTNVLIRVLAATDHRAEIRVMRTAA